MSICLVAHGIGGKETTCKEKHTGTRPTAALHLRGRASQRARHHALPGRDLVRVRHQQRLQASDGGSACCTQHAHDVPGAASAALGLRTRKAGNATGPICDDICDDTAGCWAWVVAAIGPAA